MPYRKNQGINYKKLLFQAKAYWKQSLILLSQIILLALLFPFGKSLMYTYQLNDITREPILAPFNFPIVKEQDKLESDLQEALKNVPMVFRRNQTLVEEQIFALNEYFSLSEEIRLSRSQLQESRDLVFRYRYEPQYPEARSEFSADSTTLSMLTIQFKNSYPFEMDKEPWSLFLNESTLGQFDVDSFRNELVHISSGYWAEGIYDIPLSQIISHEVEMHQEEVPFLAKPDEYQDLNNVWIKTRQEVNQLFGESLDYRQELAYALLVEFMKPNLVFDKETTDRRQKASLDRVPRFQGTVLANERIVDANTRVTPDILQKLTSLSLVVAKQEGQGRAIEKAISFLGRMIIIGVIVSFFFTFLLIYRTHIFENVKMILLLALIFVGVVGLANIFVLKLGYSPYLIPIMVAAMTLTMLFDARIGFMGVTSLTILVGIMIGNNLDFIVISLFTSSVAMYNIRRLRTRSQLFTTIFALIIASVLVFFGLGLFKGASFDTLQFDLLYLIVMSILAPIVTYGLVGLLEVGFDMTTDLTLLELLDFNHPLLKRLQREANGTFNHSVVVGNLAESCADAIGARSLLCRVGAYYHDIGKMTRSEYFIENQYSGVNKHDSLSHVMSARIIKNHVKDGLQLANDYKLPGIVSDFIPMHHGTSMTEYFYLKALEEAGGDRSKVDESNYTYPGPKPNTRETGILMICEAVEAAVRSIKDPDIFKVEEMLDKIIEKRIKEGQLNECPLTLDELRKIKGTVDGNSGMLPVLRGIYHIRIEYPEEVKEPASA